MKLQATKFVKGAMILTIAGLIAKVFSAVYRIPLQQLVGKSGFGDYATVFGLYGLLISPVLVGIPNALTKMISERVAVDDYDNAKRIYRYAIRILGCIGILISLFMILGAKLIIRVADWPDSNVYMLYAFSVSAIFIAVAGVYKSYFQGREIMIPTAMTQIIENLTKAIMGLLIIYILLKLGYSIPVVVGGAAFAVSLSYMLSAGFIVWYHRKHRREISHLEGQGKHIKPVTIGEVGKKLAKLAIPISVATAAYSIMNFIDSFTVYRRLGAVGYEENAIRDLYGTMGMAQTIINVPLTISIALMISIIPAITTAVAKKKQEDVKRKISQGIRLGIMLGLPATSGILALSGPIMTMLYGTKSGSEYLNYFAICLVFMIIGQTLAGILQGMGKYLYPAGALVISVVVKFMINHNLLVSDYRLKGAIIGSICYYIIFVALNYWRLKRETGVVLNKIEVFIKPALASVVMGVAVHFFYVGMIGIIGSNLITTGLAILCGVIIYVVVLFIVRGLQEEDISVLPYNEKIIAKLKKAGLIK